MKSKLMETIKMETNRSYRIIKEDFSRFKEILKEARTDSSKLIDYSLQEKINEEIEQSYQKEVFEKARKIVKYATAWQNRFNTSELESKANILHEDKIAKIDLIKRIFKDPEIDLEIISDFFSDGLYLDNSIKINENGKKVYSAIKHKWLFPFPIFWKTKPKVEVYRTGKWEDRLDYLANRENLKKVISNYKQKLEKSADQKQISELKEKYSI